MKHLKITIDLPVDEKQWALTDDQAKYAAKEAHKAVRKALLQFTPYSEDDVTYEIEL